MIEKFGNVINQVLRWVPLRRAEGGLTVVAIGLIALLPFVLTVNAAWEIAESVSDRDGISAFDQPVLDWMVAHRTGAVTFLAQALSLIADVLGSILIAIAAIAGLSWWRRSWTPLLVIGIGMAGSVAATILGKQAVGRLRPPETFVVPPSPLSPAFPSGHSLNATVLACLIAYLVALTARRVLVTWTAAAIALAYFVSVGWSRVYLGHHWLTDVVMGWSLGIAWVACLILAHQAARAWLRRRDAKRSRQA